MRLTGRLSGAMLGFWLAMSLPAAQAQMRAAFLIGNNNYTHLAQLANAVNDAAAFAGELRKAGFQVTHLSNVDSAVTRNAVRRFLASIANGGTGVFYFSGHGLQVAGRNFLVPVDYAPGSTEGMLSLPDLLDAVDEAKPKLAVIIIDACRDDPFPPSEPAKPTARGLSEIARPLPSGTLVLYAASSNQLALDAIPGQQSENGLFTGVLLQTIRQKDLEIRDVAQRVRYSVMQRARTVGHVQIPAIYENLAAGEFFLFDRRAPATPPRPTAASLPLRIKLVLPFALGGPSDVLTRAAVPLIASELGREVTAENIVDVQGDRVTAMLASGPKDGSLLLVMPFAAAARRLKANDNRLVPVGMLFDTPLSIAASRNSPARTLGEMLDAAKQAGRKLVMQVARPSGSPTDICGQQALKKLGDQIELVPVNGEALAVQAAISGSADLICTSSMAFRHMAAGQPNFPLKELAEVRWSASPSTEALRVQAVGPQGYDIIAPNWLGLFISADVDNEARQALAVAVGRLQRNPAFVQGAKRAHGLPVSGDQATPDGLLNALRLGVALQELN